MRIKLDLSDFLEDERKFSVLKVKPKETKTVRDVISKISHLFSVYGEEGENDDDQTRPRLGLFDEEFYIHPDETAAVLEDSGVLKLKSLPRPGRKGKKKKKPKKEPVPVIVVEDGEERKNLPREDEEEEKKFLELQKMKNDRKGSQASSKEVTGTGWLEGEEHRKTSKKRKRCQFAEEVEELQGRKKSRIEEWELSLEESRGEHHLKEVEEPGEKKKRKKERANRELSISDTSMEEWRGKKKKKKQEKQQQPSKHSCDTVGNHKKSQQHVPLMEEWEAPDPHLTEWKKQRLKDDKGGGSSSSSSSQDKVVSTSSILTTLEGISRHRCRRTSDDNSDLDLNMDIRKPCAADSVTDPLASHPGGEGEVEERFTKKKRKRKHRKSGRSWKSDASTAAQPSAGREAQIAWGSETGQPVPTGKVMPMSSFPRTHIMFNSDENDEGVVSQAGTDHSHHQNKKIHPAHTVTPGQHNQPEAVFRPAITGKVRDISRERRPPVAPTSSPSHGVRRVQGSPSLQSTEVEQVGTLYPEEHSSQYKEKSKGLVHRRPAHNNLEELATLRKICENNTITICKVDSRRDQPTKPREEPKPPPSPPHRRAPPSPPHSALQVVHDSRHSGSLQALAAMKNRSVPEVFSGVRAMGVRPIQGCSGASAPARPPMVNGSPGPASRNTTILPSDDPLQILSSNLSEIRQQYNQGCEQTRAEHRPAALHSLGAILSAMKATMDSSAVGHDKEKPRTSPTNGSKGDAGGQGASDLLVLGCVEGSDSRVAESPRKKEGLPDIYCVSPSSPSRPMHQASPFRPVPQTSPSKPVSQASPSRAVPQASPSKPVSQASPSRPIPHASSPRPRPQASPSRPVPQASPSRPIPHASPSRPVPQASPSRPLLQADPSRPLSQSILSRALQQTIPSRPLDQARPQNVATVPSTPKWPVDEVVDLESEDQPEVVTCDRGGDVKADSVAVAAPPPAIARESGKLVDTEDSSKEQDVIVPTGFSGSRIDKNTAARNLHAPNKPASVSGRLVEDGMSTGQYIAEILEDCEMVGLSASGAEKAGVTDTQTKIAAVVQHAEIVDEEEVVLDEEEVMLEEEEDGVEDGEGEEEEGEDEEEDEEEEEEEGEEDEEVEEVVEEVQDEEEETDIYANIDDDEDEDDDDEEEEDDHDQSDLDYEIIKESGTFVPMAVGRQEVQSLAPEDARGSAGVASLGNTPLRNQDNTSYPTVCPPKESRGSPHTLSKTLENGGQGQITPLVTEPPVTSILTKRIEATPFVTKPLEVIPVMTKPAEASSVMTISPEATPVMTKPPEAAPVMTLSPEVTPVIKPQEILPILTEPQEDTPVVIEPEVMPTLTEPQEDTPVLIEPQEATPVMTKPQEVTPIMTKPQEVTSIMTKPQEDKSIMTKPQEVTPVITEPEEVTPVMTQTLEVTPVITESQKVTRVLSKPEEATPASKSQEALRTNSPGKPLEDSEGPQSEDVPAVCQSTTTTSTSAASSVKQEESVKETKELPKDTKPAKDNNNQSSNLSYHELPALTAPPIAGDLIALKTVVMEECYSPTLSDYQVAKVLAVDGVCVKLKFVEVTNLQTLEVEDLNGDDLEGDTHIKEMDWRDIVEPRVLFSSG